MFENRIQKLIYYRVPKVYYVDFRPSHSTVQHSCSHSVPGQHEFLTKPKATPLYLQFNEISSGFKYTNCASAFSVAVSWINGTIKTKNFGRMPPGSEFSIFPASPFNVERKPQPMAARDLRILMLAKSYNEFGVWPPKKRPMTFGCKLFELLVANMFVSLFSFFAAKISKISLELQAFHTNRGPRNWTP